MPPLILLSIPSDIIRFSIVPFLPYISQLSLIRCTSTLHKTVSPVVDFERVVCRHLSRFVKQPQEFLEKVRQHRLQFTGSFLLECLYEEEWQANDIDLLLFCPISFHAFRNYGSSNSRFGPYARGPYYHKFSSYEQLCQYHHQQSTNIEDDVLWPFAFHLYLWELYLTQGYQQQQQQLYTMKKQFDAKSLLSIDVVHVGGRTDRLFEEIKEKENTTVGQKDRYGLDLPIYHSSSAFVAEWGDFSFTKLLYNGQGKQLQIYDGESIFNRIDELNMIDFDLLPYYDLWGISTAQKMMKRVEKYRERGFTIITDLPNDRKQAEWVFQRICIQRFKRADDIKKHVNYSQWSSAQNYEEDLYYQYYQFHNYCDYDYNCDFIDTIDWKELRRCQLSKCIHKRKKKYMEKQKRRIKKKL